MNDRSARELAAALVEHCAQLNWRIAAAESCTGGLIAAAITSIPGSSAVFDRGFVTYSNAAKTDLLGVGADLIARCGAVSREVAAAMAAGAIARSAADISVSATGIAGPDGGTAGKPVGLVHMAVARRGAEASPFERRYGDIGRDGIRNAAVLDALSALERLTRQ